jgi:hypothetical protein
MLQKFYFIFILTYRKSYLSPKSKCLHYRWRASCRFGGSNATAMYYCNVVISFLINIVFFLLSGLLQIEVLFTAVIYFYLQLLIFLETNSEN